MRGFLLKDILVSRKLMKSYALMMLAYLIFSVMGVFQIGVSVAMGQVVMMMLPLGVFSYDEAVKWSRFGAVLPQGRRDMVRGRYAFALSCTLLVTAYSLAVCVLFSLMDRGDLGESVASALGSLAVGLLILAIMLPLNYRLGPERARPYLFLVILAPFALVFLLQYTKVLNFARLNVTVTAQHVIWVTAGLVALMLGVLVVSYLVSFRIVNGKEY